MSKFWEKLQAERARQAKIQEMLNSRHERNGKTDKRTLKFYAGQLLSEYPQYNGYWDSDEWQPCIVKRDVITKMGEAFKAGDITLVKTFNFCGAFSQTAFSFRNACLTAI